MFQAFGSLVKGILPLEPLAPVRKAQRLSDTLLRITAVSPREKAAAQASHYGEMLRQVVLGTWKPSRKGP